MKTVKRKVILNVEDNPALRTLLREFLHHNGFTVVEAVDGEEAIRIADQIKPDLILMDIQLPKLSGLDATRAIRSSPGSNQIPIIAVTGFALSGDEENARGAGCDDYVAKPYDLDVLLEKVQEYVG